MKSVNWKKKKMTVQQCILQVLLSKHLSYFYFQPSSGHNGNIRVEVHDSFSPTFGSRSLPSISICSVHSLVFHERLKQSWNPPWTVEKWNWLLLLQVQKDSNTQTISRVVSVVLSTEQKLKKHIACISDWIIYGLFFSFKIRLIILLIHFKALNYLEWLLTHFI